MIIRLAVDDLQQQPVVLRFAGEHVLNVFRHVQATPHVDFFIQRDVYVLARFNVIRARRSGNRPIVIFLIVVGHPRTGIRHPRAFDPERADRRAIRSWRGDLIQLQNRLAHAPVSHDRFKPVEFYQRALQSARSAELQPVAHAHVRAPRRFAVLRNLIAVGPLKGGVRRNAVLQRDTRQLFFRRHDFRRRQKFSRLVAQRTHLAQFRRDDFGLLQRRFDVVAISGVDGFFQRRQAPFGVLDFRV